MALQDLLYICITFSSFVLQLLAMPRYIFSDKFFLVTKGKVSLLLCCDSDLNPR